MLRCRRLLGPEIRLRNEAFPLAKLPAKIKAWPEADHRKRHRCRRIARKAGRCLPATQDMQMEPGSSLPSALASASICGHRAESTELSCFRSSVPTPWAQERVTTVARLLRLASREGW